MCWYYAWVCFLQIFTKWVGLVWKTGDKQIYCLIIKYLFEAGVGFYTGFYILEFLYVLCWLAKKKNKSYNPKPT